MPRINRLARAREHPDPLVGCIMTVQEKIKLLGRAMVGCQCPELEGQLDELREQLSRLREFYQEQRAQLRRLQFHGQESLDRYRARIASLLQTNSSRMTARVYQEDTIRREISALRTTVDILMNTSTRRRAIPSCYHVPWQVDISSRPMSWTLNETWVSRHPNENPGRNPNDVNIRVNVSSSSNSESPENFI